MENIISFGILTVSDRCSQGKAVDTSGDNLEEIINAIVAGTNPVYKFFVKTRDCVPDDCDRIKDILIKWSDIDNIHVILTTGGTGFGSRDITPEATKLVIDREAPGLAIGMIVESLKVTPYAMLSRAICGIRKKSIIVNLPGSKKGSEECFHAIKTCLPHGISLLDDKMEDIKKAHSLIQAGNHSLNFHDHHQNHYHQLHQMFNLGGTIATLSQVDVSKVARRPREQNVYPMMPLDDAVNIVLNHARHLQIEKINLRNDEQRVNLIGHVLAENVSALESYPPFPASIKDGYAVIASDGIGPRKVVGGMVAGSSPNFHPEGEKICVRINTGAPVPQGMDAVVQVEDTKLIEEADDGRTEVLIDILKEPVVGQDIRKIGSDIAKYQLVLEKGTIITSTELGLLATLGINEISVFKHPSIGILSTGDELINAWEDVIPKPGCIRDSNKVTLFHLLREKGFKSIDCGVARDSPDDVLANISNALDKVDVLITSGSVSMGERDLIKDVLLTDLKSTIHFGRVNMKPGKPVTFATCNWYDGKTKLIFALPGNPSSAIVTSHVFVLPALRKMAGFTNFKNKLTTVKLKERFQLDSRPELKRAILRLEQIDSMDSSSSICSLPTQSTSSTCDIIATTTGNQISSRLGSLKGANGLLCIPQHSPEISCLEPGACVNAIIIGDL